MSSSHSSIRIVAFSTILSRLTGLLRDMLVYAVFGTSAINSAFIIAFTVPNLFRRFMGEGALTSALVPVLAHEQTKNGKQDAFNLFNKVWSRAAIALVVVIVLGIAAFQLVWFFKLEARWTLAARLGLWVFPYLFFICLSALIGAVLNLQKKFAATALAQIWVNLTMALMLGGIGIWVTHDEFARMLWVCGGVLLGGLLQLLLPGYALTREGWRPKFDLGKDERLNEVWRLLGPGLIGATVAQVNTVISQFLAFGLNDSAVSVLFLANRLMQLPLGVFAIAVTTVTFPIIARKAAEGDRAGFAASYREGSTLIQAIMIPAGVGLALLAQPILVAVFKWGAFNEASVRATAPILAVYALAIPFYAACTFTTRALHSLKDTTTPVRWGAATLLINLTLSLVLKEVGRPYDLGTLGLALANAISTAVFAWGLNWELKKKGAEIRRVADGSTSAQVFNPGSKGLEKTPKIKIISSAALMAVVIVPLVLAMPPSKLGRILAIVIGAPTGLAIYAASLFFTSRETFAGLKKLALK
jgi:putative peptidoglycan lipid II flippase